MISGGVWMSSHINQACWIVPDLHTGIGEWLKLGVGPFFTFDVDLPDAIYRGRVEPLTFSVALAQAGPVQIELIEQRSAGPSAYRDTVPVGSTGFHHIFKIVKDYDAEICSLKARGIVLATEAFLGQRFCYADLREEIGTMLEIAEDSEKLRALNDAVAKGSREWDGRQDPIRSLNGVMFNKPES
jgi:hypothetical protein